MIFAASFVFCCIKIESVFRRVNTNFDPIVPKACTKSKDLAFTTWRRIFYILESVEFLKMIAPVMALQTRKVKEFYEFWLFQK